MALTVVPHHLAENDQGDISSISIRPVVIQFDTSYPLNGYPVTPSMYGFSRKVLGILFSNGAVHRAGAYQVGVDPMSGRLRLFTVAGQVWAEVASATNVSSVVVRGLAIGY